MIEINKIHHGDCMNLFKNIKDQTIDLILTDIPYSEVSRKDNGLRNLNKENADILTFNIKEFLLECDRVCSGTIIIFCGNEQYSEIYRFFSEKQKKSLGTVRQIIWGKTNPSPMNGKYIYLSSTENAVWFRKKGGVFNAHCKKNFFNFPTGRSKLHPTEKNHELLKELILDNSKEKDLILDPCAGSGSHLLVAKQNNRNFIGFEFSEEYFKIAEERIKNIKYGDWRDLPDKDYKQCEVCGKFFTDVERHKNKVHGFKEQQTLTKLKKGGKFFSSQP